MIERRAALGVCAFWIIPIIATLLASYLPIVKYDQYPAGVFGLIVVYLTPAIILALFHLPSPRGSRMNQVAGEGTRLLRPKADFDQAEFWIGLGFVLLFLVGSTINYLVFGNVLSEGITGARYQDIQFGGEKSIFGGLAIYGSGAPGIFAVILIDRARSAQRTPFWASLLLISAFAALFLHGGRNSFAINAIFVVIYVWMRRVELKALSPNLNKRIRRLMRRLGILIAIGGAFSLYIFLERANIRNSNYLIRLQIFEREYGIAIPFLDKVPEFLAPVAQIIVSFYFYITSGYYSISNYFMPGAPAEPIGGGYTFYTYFVLIDYIFGSSLSEGVQGRLIYTGLYYTFPGGLYIDFGLFGVFVFAVLWLWICFKSTHRAMVRPGPTVLFSTFCLTTLAVSGMYTAFSIGSGPSLLIFSVVFGFRRLLVDNKRNRGGAPRHRSRHGVV